MNLIFYYGLPLLPDMYSLRLNGLWGIVDKKTMSMTTEFNRLNSTEVPRYIIII